MCVFSIVYLAFQMSPIENSESENLGTPVSISQHILGHTAHVQFNQKTHSWKTLLAVHAYFNQFV